MWMLIYFSLFSQNTFTQSSEGLWGTWRKRNGWRSTATLHILVLKYPSTFSTTWYFLLDFVLPCICLSNLLRPALLLQRSPVLVLIHLSFFVLCFQVLIFSYGPHTIMFRGYFWSPSLTLDNSGHRGGHMHGARFQSRIGYKQGKNLTSWTSAPPSFEIARDIWNSYVIGSGC